MFRRLFWFGLGIGLTALVVIKGREYYERFTPKGVSDQIDRTSVQARSWVDDFVNTMTSAMREREVELHEALGLDGENLPVQETRN